MSTQNKHKPFVSFIIPVYNSAEYIAKVINSILNQRYNIDKIETIIIDDNSDDNSLKILQKFKKRHPKTIKLFKHKDNKGQATARNFGIKNSRGDLIIFLDSDISLSSEFLTKTVKIHRDNKVKGIFGKILPGDIYPFDKFQKYLYEAKRGAQNLTYCKKVSYNHFLYSLTSVKKEAIESTGFFDTNISKYGGEDTEYAFRMGKIFPNGLYFCPFTKGYHHDYKTFRKVQDSYQIFGEHNVPYIINKHPDMRSIYFYNYLKGPFYMVLIGSILKTKKCREFLMYLYKVLPIPLCFWVVKLILASALLDGMSSAYDRI